MRIKITVAIALALAAIGLKSLDSGRSVQERILPAEMGTETDVAWPADENAPHSP